MKYKSFSHDYGGALKLFYYLLGHDVRSCDFNLAGPALKLKSRFETHIDKIYLNDNIDCVITSTSFPSSYEYNKLCEYSNYKTKVVMDNWTNYERRLTRNNKTIVPDEIIVFDKYAEKLAHKYYSTNILLENDFEAEFIKKKYKKNCKNDHIIFASEPLRKEAKKIHGNEKYYGFDEFDCFNAIVDKYGKKIKIKLHPLESECKYGTQFEYLSRDIEEYVSKESTIIGIKSTALLKAHILCENVFRFNPTDYMFPISPINELHKYE